MRTAFLILLCTVGISGAVAQQDVLADRHARIAQLQREEAHAEVAKLIELQVRQAVGNAWQDSIHTYVYGLGLAVWKSKDVDAGIAAARALNEQVQREDKHDLHRLTAMEALGKLLFDMGHMPECVLTDSMALAFADAHRGIPPIRRGRILLRLGLDHGQMGDHTRSLGYYRKAREQFSRSDTLLAALMAETSNGMGSAYWHLGEHHRADTAYTEALGYWEKSSDLRRDFRMVGTLINLGILWQSTGDLSRSKANYFEAIRRCGIVADTARDPRLRDEALLGRTRGYVNLATVYFAVGDDERSRELLEMALSDREELLEPNDPKLLGVKDRLADLEIQAKNFAKAEPWVLAFLKACEEQYGSESEEYIRTCSKLGEVYAGLGRIAEADSLFKRSIDLNAAKESAGTQPELAIAYRRHGQFCLKQGRPTDAANDFASALAIIIAIHGEQDHRTAAYELLLAEAMFAQGDAAATLHHAEHVLGLLADRIEALRAGSVPRSWPQPHLLPDALYWKAKAQRALGQVPNDHWKADMDLSVRAMERNRAAYDGEGSQLGFIGQQKIVFDQAIDLAAEAYTRNSAPSDLDRFLALTEADRSILLKSRLNEFASLRYSGLPDSILAEESRLVGALELDPADPASIPDLARRERDLDAFLQRLSKSHPNYFALRYGETRVTIKDVRDKLLTTRRTLLLYAFTGERLHVLVIGPDTVALMQAPAEGIARTAQDLNKAIVERNSGSYVRASRALYDLVFAPVAGLLRGPELLIIPDGALQTVNFETLIFEPPDDGKLGEHALIQRYTISYLLSATTAVQFTNLAGPVRRNVLAFAPGFADELKQRYLANVRDSALIDRDYLRYVRQPFATSTAQALGELFTAKVMLGAEANEQRFRELASDHGILHLGTHAEMNETSPLYSRLVLSKNGAGTGAEDDGYLHAYELYELDLHAQLAVLTACETGVGRNEEGEGVRSLGYSFAYAGCPSLVTSLWSIDEKASSEIIARFYEHLANGLPKNEALRQAKLEHLSNASNEQALPFYWAGMVLVGDVTPIDGTAQGGLSYLWWALGVLAIVITAFWWYRRR